MRTESRLAYSEALGHDLEYRVYTADRDANGFLVGQPIVAFPSMNGRVWDWEGWGMIEAVAHLIDAGRITLYCADGVDWQSWTNGGVPVEERAKRHSASVRIRRIVERIEARIVRVENVSALVEKRLIEQDVTVVVVILIVKRAAARANGGAAIGGGNPHETQAR